MASTMHNYDKIGYFKNLLIFLVATLGLVVMMTGFVILIKLGGNLCGL